MLHILKHAHSNHSHFPQRQLGKHFSGLMLFLLRNLQLFLFRDIVTSVTGLIYSSTCFAVVFSAVVNYQIDPFVHKIYPYKTFCRKFDLLVEQ